MLDSYLPVCQTNGQLVFLQTNGDLAMPIPTVPLLSEHIFIDLQIQDKFYFQTPYLTSFKFYVAGLAFLYINKH